jgi:hypothetical protein
MPTRDFPTTLAAFRRLFSDDAACATYLERLRWPHGFKCPKCKTPGEPWHLGARAGAIRCPSCRADISLTAGTVMHRTHVPLATWFSGAFLITSAAEMTATQFQEKLQLSRYETAYQMRRKLRASMARSDRTVLDGPHPAEADVMPLGEPQGRGKKAALFVVALLETYAAEPSAGGAGPAPRRAGRLRLGIVKDGRAATTWRFIHENMIPGAAAHCVTQSHDRTASTVYLLLSNVTSWLLGTDGGASMRRLQAHCNEYAFRFNRRLDPAAAFNVVLGLPATTRDLWSTDRRQAPVASTPLAMPFT